MLLHATLKLENVSSWKNDEKGIIYYKLVSTSLIYSNKLGREHEVIEEISIPQRLSYLNTELNKYIGQTITVQVLPRIYDGKFNGFELASEQYQVAK